MCVCLHICLRVCVFSVCVCGYVTTCTYLHNHYMYVLTTCTCLHTHYMYLSTYSPHVLVYILTTCTCLHTHYMYLSTYSLHVLVYILTTCTCLHTHYMYLSTGCMGGVGYRDTEVRKRTVRLHRDTWDPDTYSLHVLVYILTTCTCLQVVEVLV